MAISGRPVLPGPRVRANAISGRTLEAVIHFPVYLGILIGIESRRTLCSARLLVAQIEFGHSIEGQLYPIRNSEFVEHLEQVVLDCVLAEV